MTDQLKNVGAERRILGSILTEAGDLHKVSSIIRQDDFYRQDYRFVYGLLAEMILRGERPDVVTLSELARSRLEGRQDDFSRILRTILDIGMIGRCYNMTEMAEIVADYARRRRLQAKASALMEAAADMSLDIDTVAATFSNDIQGITALTDKHVGDMGAATTELIAMLARRGKGDGLTTGLIDLDRIVTAFEPGQLIVIAGRPGHGKSALAGTIAVNLAKRGKKILYFSMEMSMGELAGRFVSRLAHLPGGLLKNPAAMTAEQRTAFSRGVEAVEALPITIDTQGSLTPGDVASVATRQQRTDGLDLVIIDYLQLMSGGGKSENRVQEVTGITRALKNLAVVLGVPVVLVSQLNRANDKEKRLPRSSDLRDSGSTEQDANVIILLHREAAEGGLEEKTSCLVVKQRDGRTGACNLYFATAFGYFANYDSSRDVPY